MSFGRSAAASFRGEVPLGVWIRRLMHGKAVDYRRRPVRANLVSLEELSLEDRRLGQATSRDDQAPVFRLSWSVSSSSPTRRTVQALRRVTKFCSITTRR